jgi:hypothetical protein
MVTGRRIETALHRAPTPYAGPSQQRDAGSVGSRQGRLLRIRPRRAGEQHGSFQKAGRLAEPYWVRAQPTPVCEQIPRHTFATSNAHLVEIRLALLQGMRPPLRTRPADPLVSGNRIVPRQTTLAVDGALRRTFCWIAALGDAVPTSLLRPGLPVAALPFPDGRLWFVTVWKHSACVDRSGSETQQPGFQSRMEGIRRRKAARSRARHFGHRIAAKVAAQQEVDVSYIISHFAGRQWIERNRASTNLCGRAFACSSRRCLGRIVKTTNMAAVP